MIGSTRIKGLKDLLVGLIYITVGSASFALAHSYSMGTSLHMGPGYFPALVGGILVALGIGSICIGLRKKEPDPIIKLKIEPLLLILAGVLTFSFLIDRAGLVVAIAAMVFFACFRRLLSNPLEVIATYVVLTIFSALVFIYGFGMSIPLVWWHS
jgi:hypothetical protein